MERRHHRVIPDIAVILGILGNPVIREPAGIRDTQVYQVIPDCPDILDNLVIQDGVVIPGCPVAWQEPAWYGTRDPQELQENFRFIMMQPIII